MVACSSSSPPPLEPPAGDSAGAAGNVDADVIAGGAGSGIEEEGIKEPGTFGESVSEGRTSGPMMPVYFDFDQFVIRDDMKARMDENAAFLTQNPMVRIEIQGNCDDRGTSEYNIALGEKRALAAKKYLVGLGVDPDRMDVVSFGEERPLDTASSPEARAKNRRDDFVIVGN
jgi:peptidoglycan-associated lipoprotein